MYCRLRCLHELPVVLLACIRCTTLLQVVIFMKMVFVCSCRVGASGGGAQARPRETRSQFLGVTFLVRKSKWKAVAYDPMQAKVSPPS